MGVDLAGARILVTGSHGFLGRHVVPALLATGAHVTPSWHGVHDLRYETDVLEAVLISRPDIVVQLAGVDETKKPASALKDGLAMAMNVIHATAAAQSKLIMVHRPGELGSVWGDLRNATFALAEAYRDQHGLDVTHLVLSDLYGPFDRFERKDSRIVPHMLWAVRTAKALGAKEVELQGDGGKMVAPLYVADAAAAIVLSCFKKGPERPLWLPGPEKAPLSQVAAALSKVADFKGTISWNRKLDFWGSAFDEGGGVRDVLGWKPSIKLEDGLQATINWCLSEEKAEV